jgi:hypothetical protein
VNKPRTNPFGGFILKSHEKPKNLPRKICKMSFFKNRKVDRAPLEEREPLIRSRDLSFRPVRSGRFFERNINLSLCVLEEKEDRLRRANFQLGDFTRLDVAKQQVAAVFGDLFVVRAESRVAYSRVRCSAA